MKKKQRKALKKLIDKKFDECLENLDTTDLKEIVFDIIREYLNTYEFQATYYKNYKKAKQRFIEDSYL